jgi:formylglycine-generating enzyme required for sulfatase activity
VESRFSRYSTDRERRPMPQSRTLQWMRTLITLLLVVILGVETTSIAHAETPTPKPSLTPSPIPTITTNRQWSPVRQFVDGVESVLVPPGCFMMGMTKREMTILERQAPNEYFSSLGPPFKICLKPFWIDRYVVTNEQFDRLHGQAKESGRWTDPNRPRETIAWFEARDFCALRGGRLPTEAEWEYAARGPDALTYPWGRTFVASVVVYYSNSLVQKPVVENQNAAVVNDQGKPARPRGASWVGAYDMAGNAWQWTSTIDDFERFPYPYKADDGRENNVDTTRARIMRGGGFLSGEYALHSAYREGLPSDTRDFEIGFRCIRDS